MSQLRQVLKTLPPPPPLAVVVLPVHAALPALHLQAQGEHKLPALPSTQASLGLIVSVLVANISSQLHAREWQLLEMVSEM